MEAAEYLIVLLDDVNMCAETTLFIVSATLETILLTQYLVKICHI